MTARPGAFSAALVAVEVDGFAPVLFLKKTVPSIQLPLEQMIISRCLEAQFISNSRSFFRGNSVTIRFSPYRFKPGPEKRLSLLIPFSLRSLWARGGSLSSGDYFS